MKKERVRNPGTQEKRKNPGTGYIYLVKNPASNEASICAWDSVLYPGTSVVIPTRYGLDLGVIVASADQLGKAYEPGSLEFHGACHQQRFEESGEEELLYQDGPDEHPCESCRGCNPPSDPEEVSVASDVLWIDRLATPSDLNRYQELTAKEDEAMRICREKIALHKLDMKLVTAHYLLGEPKIIFFFTADVRVDFRELVKDLVSVFKIRIELRQIGVRDESRVLGGLAVCGRDFCCHSVTDKLNPVSIKMAKEQNLSLNSMKISGPCGRLLCCLSYEYDFYIEEKRNYPPEGSRLKVGYDLLRITEVNILSKQITLAGGEGRMVSLPQKAVFYNDATARWEITKEWADEFLSP
ncbi:MAG: regulatory iron-sulfur-containing complex subunit RicT [Sphaerochaeta sp.]|jgi:cell fate regulator YaaT (PSP1 superfamily)|nr:regulatory iron-sulfur-containing complex subunit RicT [Sphaerochaeta sp.]